MPNAPSCGARARRSNANDVGALSVSKPPNARCRDTNTFRAEWQRAAPRSAGRGGCVFEKSPQRLEAGDARCRDTNTLRADGGEPCLTRAVSRPRFLWLRYTIALWRALLHGSYRAGICRPNTGRPAPGQLLPGIAAPTCRSPPRSHRTPVLRCPTEFSGCSPARAAALPAPRCRPATCRRDADSRC